MKKHHICEPPSTQDENIVPILHILDELFRLFVGAAHSFPPDKLNIPLGNSVEHVPAPVPSGGRAEAAVDAQLAHFSPLD